MGRPDALMMPATIKVGATMAERVESSCIHCEPLLECDYAGGERAQIRTQPHGRLFVTRDPLDTIYFPTGHPRSGQPRYVWKRQPDGSEHGFLVEGASDAAE